MVGEPLSQGKHARLREQVRRQLIEERSSLKIYDNSNAEIEAEVTARVDDILRRRAESGQMELEFPDRDPLEASRLSKRESCTASRDKRIALRDRIVELLEAAGATGLSREDLAERLGKRVTDVCSPVSHLLRTEQADQPRRQPSRRGSTEAVVVLTKFIKEGKS